MKLLFIHQNFPGQYLHLAPALAARGHEVHALAMRTPARPVPGVRLHLYKVPRAPLAQQQPLLRDMESKALRAEGVVAVCDALARQGFTPDVICVHPGWGEALLLRTVWPQVPQLHFVEFLYAEEGQDVGFDPEFGPASLDTRCRLQMKNLCLLQALSGMDQGVSPTRWQASTVPAHFQDRLAVVHDGIDTRRAAPHRKAVFKANTQAGVALSLTRDDPVLSFVNRNLEPNRGYHRFMRALPAVLAQAPQAQVVIVGGDGASYGTRPREGSHQQIYFDEIAPALSAEQRARIHFVGRVPHASLMALFQITRAHVYLTYPFVLSWSMLEAMACGALVIGSDTAPVREVLQPGVNGQLVDFFDAPALAQAVLQALAYPAGEHPLSRAARDSIVKGYDLHTVCLPRHVAMVEALGARAAQGTGARPGGAGSGLAGGSAVAELNALQQHPSLQP